MNQLTIAFAIGYFFGVATGPVAIFGIAFYFASGDRRAERDLRDHRAVDDVVKSDVIRKRSGLVGPF
jgi:hypothetical protein